MKRLGITVLLVFSMSVPLFSYSELRTELFWRSSSGTFSSSGVSTAYAGTEADVRLTSASSWDGGFTLTLFGGAQRSLSLTIDGVAQDISAEKVGWYYGAGTAATIDFTPYFGTEFSLVYETAWQFMEKVELSLDTLRVGLRAMTYTREGFVFILGLEYSRPLWGRLIDRRGSEVDVARYTYDANGFAVSVGVGYQVW